MAGPCIVACGGEVYKDMCHVTSKENVKIEKEPKTAGDWKTTTLDQGFSLIAFLDPDLFVLGHLPNTVNVNFVLIIA